MSSLLYILHLHLQATSFAAAHLKTFICAIRSRTKMLKIKTRVLNVFDSEREITDRIETMGENKQNTHKIMDNERQKW